MTSATGAPRSAPAATTRVRRSRSVMIPSVVAASTTTHVAPCLGHPLRRLADRRVRRAQHERRAHELATARWAGFGGGSAPPCCSENSSSERVT